MVVTLLVWWEGFQVAGNDICTMVPWADPSLAPGITKALLQWPFRGDNGTGTSGTEAAPQGTATSSPLSSAEEQKFRVQALEIMR